MTTSTGKLEENLFAFGTKAGTLARLRPMVTAAEVPPQVVVHVSDWNSARERAVENIIAAFPSRPLAVRSSATAEDTAETSNAGAFESVTNIPAEPGPVAGAVDRVIRSFERIPAEDMDCQEVLIQPMIGNVVFSGVILTRDLDTGGPYYVINYDDFTGRTDTVTGGGESKAVIIHRDHAEAVHSPRISKIVALARELESLTGSDALDIEFCLDAELNLFLLQVRPLAAQRQWRPIKEASVSAALEETAGCVAEALTTTGPALGATTILGDMPDWNPAEMIGNTPRPLAISLYESLITDRVWAEARAQMGYRRVDAPLMVSLAGRPYIDVRLSLNSFLPADLDDGLAERLVDWQLAHLSENRELHDKIEFTVTPTCHDFAFGRWHEKLGDAGFSGAELETLETSLQQLTRDALTGGPSQIEALLATTRAFYERAAAPEDLGTDNLAGTLDEIRTCGTLPFSILARHGFIGVILLRSLVNRGILEQHDADAFMLSVQTIASEMVHHMSALASGDMPLQDFLARYGHLRPGTYDILSWRYDEKPELYLGGKALATVRGEPFSLAGDKRGAVDRCLDECGYGIGVDALFAYIAAAIAAREEAKFAFSRGVSNLLSMLKRWGADAGLSGEQVSFLRIDDIVRDHSDVPTLRARAADAEQRHGLTRALRLPSLIVEIDDVFVVRPMRGQPNFITSKSVAGTAVHLHTNEALPLDGQIVLIESADPGFDWIFSHKIAGLITMHGGANSHMAIRCAEFALPAAIGCGEKLFNELIRKNVIELNAGQRKVTGH